MDVEPHRQVARDQPQDDQPAATLPTQSVPELLSPAFMKLQHADTHFSSLGAAIRSFLDKHPLELAPDPVDEEGWRVVRLGATTAPPPEWGVVLGDGIYDCRSALDGGIRHYRSAHPWRR